MPLRASSLFLVSILAVGVAACQPVPRPFQPDDKQLNAADFARLGTRGGILVQGASLGDAVLDRRFAGLLAAALRDAGVPALSSDHDPTNRYVFSGTLQDNGFGRRETTVSGTWRLTDPLGREVVTFDARERVEATGWRTGDPATSTLVAEALAHQLAARLDNRDVAQTGAPAPPQDVRLAIWMIEGLATDQEPLLASALRSALRVRGIEVAAVNDPAALVVTGWVEREPGSAGNDRISIGWALLEPNGNEIGTVFQANELPHDTFDASLPQAAPQIAGSAADGLVEMLLRRQDKGS